MIGKCLNISKPQATEYESHKQLQITRNKRKYSKNMRIWLVACNAHDGWLFRNDCKVLEFRNSKFSSDGLHFLKRQMPAALKGHGCEEHDNAVWNCTGKSFTAWFSWNHDMVHRLEHLQIFHRPLLTNFLQCFLQGQLCRCTGAKLWL